MMSPKNPHENWLSELAPEVRARIEKEIRHRDRRRQAAEFKEVMGLTQIPRQWR
jgi:hypothetical protein